MKYTQTGFLNAGVSSAKGNQGLKDLVLALKWVQANIEEFGGDSSRVVLNGGSNAAYAVSFLTLSPLAKGTYMNLFIHEPYWFISQKLFQSNPINKVCEYIDLYKYFRTLFRGYFPIRKCSLSMDTTDSAWTCVKECTKARFSCGLPQ